MYISNYEIEIVQIILTKRIGSVLRHGQKGPDPTGHVTTLTVDEGQYDPLHSMLRIRIRIWSGFNQVSWSGSGSRSAKITHKGRIFFWNFMFWSAGCSFLRAEGFFSNFDVLYGSLGIGIAFFDQKKIQLYIFSIFGHKNPGSGSVFSLKCWIRIRNT